jgi:hypothetical protein
MTNDHNKKIFSIEYAFNKEEDVPPNHLLNIYN